jgi:uncharacterized protein (DUF427 family)
MTAANRKQPRTPPGPGQESVWDYPRPPRVEPTGRRVQVLFGGVEIVDTRRAQRVLETSHPPVYYIPREDVRMESLTRSPRGSSYCEFKGWASYFTVGNGEPSEEAAAWSYEEPAPGFEAIRNHIAFYSSRMDECRVDGELVTAQPGDFYGGWITSDIVGPFKGGLGTLGW